MNKMLLPFLLLSLFSCKFESKVDVDTLNSGNEKRRLYYIQPKKVKREGYKQGRFLAAEGRRTIWMIEQQDYQGVLDSIGEHYKAKLSILQSTADVSNMYEKRVFDLLMHTTDKSLPDTIFIADTIAFYLKPFVRDVSAKQLKVEGVWSIQLNRGDLMQQARVN